MSRLAALAWVLVTLTACQSSPDLSYSTPGTSVRQQFETAIGDTIVREVKDTLPQLKGTERATYLRDKRDQFRQGVDFSIISTRLKEEFAVLEALVVTEDLLQFSGDPLAKFQAYTSLDWDLDAYNARFAQEIAKLDQTIAVLQRESDIDSFDLQEHVARVRRAAHYPDDSFNGRQQYLDDLSQAMIQAQADWHAFLKRYEPSELAITGEEQSQRTFTYNNLELVINLGRVEDLPAFELRPLAVFYGYPGLQSLGKDSSGSLQSNLNLPAYAFGWAAFVLDTIGTRDVANTVNYLYFSRLIASLAMADLNLSTAQWTREQALDYVYLNTPYSRHRVNLMLNEVALKPGHYVAALAGKLAFTELHERCLETAGDCDATFNQRVVDEAVLPFELLQEKLIRR